MALHGREQALTMLDQSRARGGSARLRALSWVQEAVVHVSCQDWRATLAALDELGSGFELLTVREQVAALLNRGLAHLSLLQLGEAHADLDAALRLSQENGLRPQVFKARHNLGCLEYYAGNLPEAIRVMREADEVDAPVARVRAQHDLALVLLEAGLLDQARDMLTRALGVACADGLRLEEADLRLDLATTALVRDDPGTARAHLDAALVAYRARGARERQRSTALLRAFVDVTEARVPRAVDRTLAPFLDVPRLVTPDERLAARVHVEVLLLRGEPEQAVRALQRLRGRAPRGLAAEMHERLLAARVAAARGHRSAARRTVRQALRRLTERQAPSQSLEIRSALALHGRRLADFDVDDALASGSPARVFDAVERWRAVSHRLPLVSEPTDARANALLAELRQARLEGAAPGEAGAQRRERAAELEWEVSRLDWSRAERGDAETLLSPTTHGKTGELLESRHEQALVMVAHSGQEYALTVTSRGTWLNHLGPATEVATLADQLSRDLRARAYAGTNRALEEALGRAVAESVSALGTRLFGGLRLDDDRPLVVVPGRTLMSVPWAMLPQLAGRPIVVTPSVTRWSTAVSGSAPGRQSALTVQALTGPGLRRAVAEGRAVAALWRSSGADASSRDSATSADARGALAGADLVHVAAHGTHEPQSPWFSSLHLDDGPVFAHELPRPATTRHVVLSACEAGRLDPRPGDEPLGLTAALLATGVASVVAPVAPVRDDVAERAMVGYHRRLTAGVPAATALARTVADHPEAGAFCLFGSDWSSTR